MSAVISVFKIIFILVAGQLLGAVIGGVLQSMGVINFGPSSPISLAFAVLGILIVGTAVSWVSN